MKNYPIGRGTNTSIHKPAYITGGVFEKQKRLQNKLLSNLDTKRAFNNGI